MTVEHGNQVRHDGPDPTEVEERLALVNSLLRSHAGSVDLVDVSATGRVEVRFRGMCAGCSFRPMTMYAVIRRELLQVPGVTDVFADGARVSDKGMERLDLYLGDTLYADMR